MNQDGEWRHAVNRRERPTRRDVNTAVRASEQSIIGEAQRWHVADVVGENHKTIPVRVCERHAEVDAVVGVGCLVDLNTANRVEGFQCISKDAVARSDGDLVSNVAVELQGKSTRASVVVREHRAHHLHLLHHRGVHSLDVRAFAKHIANHRHRRTNGQQRCVISIDGFKVAHLLAERDHVLKSVTGGSG